MERKCWPDAAAVELAGTRIGARLGVAVLQFPAGCFNGLTI
jgi:hypothetical protein